ncbi:MAG TPA: tripartite tricarboxylate transporter permease [Myxococcota bacterium]|nr:tripartite tricarboxylate transporter permease [Myxococcota bacterium]
MESILHAALEGFRFVFSWPNVLYPVGATLLCMFVSLVPGIGGMTLMALAIPFTLFWDREHVALLFGAFMGGATFMGSLSSILLGIPGKASNAATTFDGYPMARQGKAKTAIGAAASASALGSTFGVFVLIALIPLLRGLIVQFGPAEFLALVIWGLTTIAVVTQGSVVKGLVAAGVGMLLSYVGYDPRTAELRFTFGTLYLEDGIPLPPLFLGLFAMTEMLDLATSGRATVSGQTKAERLSGSLREGALSVFRHPWLFLRSSIIGTVVGIIPGVGGTVAGFVAYGQAAQSARKHGGRFGQGDIRGVLAPEAANDAKDAGALIPTFAFGIPGGTGTAMLLTVMTMHGIAPGKTLLTDQLGLVFVLVWSLFLSNWVTSLVGVATVGPAARMTVIHRHFLVPIILVLTTVGAYAYQGRIEDVCLTYATGALGFWMKKHGWSRVPLVIALMLGGIFETYLGITLRLHHLGRIDFWHRPIAAGLLAAAALSLGLRWAQAARGRPPAAAQEMP